MAANQCRRAVEGGGEDRRAGAAPAESRERRQTENAGRGRFRRTRSRRHRGSAKAVDALRGLSWTTPFWRAASGSPAARCRGARASSVVSRGPRELRARRTFSAGGDVRAPPAEERDDKPNRRARAEGATARLIAFHRATRHSPPPATTRTTARASAGTASALRVRRSAARARVAAVRRQARREALVGGARAPRARRRADDVRPRAGQERARWSYADKAVRLLALRRARPPRPSQRGHSGRCCCRRFSAPGARERGAGAWRRRRGSRGPRRARARAGVCHPFWSIRGGAASRAGGQPVRARRRRCALARAGEAASPRGLVERDALARERSAESRRRAGGGDRRERATVAAYAAAETRARVACHSRWARRGELARMLADAAGEYQRACPWTSTTAPPAKPGPPRVERLMKGRPDAGDDDADGTGRRRGGRRGRRRGRGGRGRGPVRIVWTMSNISRPPRPPSRRSPAPCRPSQP